ncbi:hypothetical protein ES703_118744 [subsurface metagenome]
MLRSKYSRFGYLALLILAIVIPLITKNPYVTHLFVLTFIYAIFALGYDILIGTMGQFSFGHQALWGMGAYVSGLLALDLGVPVPLSMLAGIAGTALFGLFIGWVALRLRSAYLAIITMGFAMILQVIVINWIPVTHGWEQVRGIPFASFGNIIILRTPLSYYYLVTALLILVIFILIRMQNSRLGRGLCALRENEERAVSLGIPVFKYFLLDSFR